MEGGEDRAKMNYSLYNTLVILYQLNLTVKD